MSTLAPEAITAPASSVTPDHLLDAPLPQLLAEFGVEVTVSDGGPGFTGGAAVRPDGSLLFVRPPSRPAAEWEMMARSMLGSALRVPLPELPAPYQLTEL